MAYLDIAGILHFFCGDGDRRNVFHHFQRDASTVIAANVWNHSKVEVKASLLKANLRPDAVSPALGNSTYLPPPHFFVCDDRGHNLRVNVR